MPNAVSHRHHEHHHHHDHHARRLFVFFFPNRVQVMRGSMSTSITSVLRGARPQIGRWRLSGVQGFER